MPVAKNFRHLIAVLLLMALCDMATAQDFKAIFRDNYNKAAESANKLRPLIRRLAGQYGEDSRLIESVIFPELMRYNNFYDAVETGSLMSLYTTLGQDYADFSIGLLQQKPSFASAIEKYITTSYPLRKWADLLGMKNTGLLDNFQNRNKRIDRLTDTEWQIKYFIAMLKCIREKHNNYLKGLSTNDQLTFIATAYNCGWDKSSKYIKSFQSKAFYSLQMFSGTSKYCFSQISAYRYAETAANQQFD